MNKNKSIKSKKLKKYWGGKPQGIAAGLSTDTDDDKMTQLLQAQQLAKLMSQIGGAISGGVLFAGGLFKDFLSPQFTTTPKTYQTSGPISYQLTDDVDSNTEMSNLNKLGIGNTISSTASGAGLGLAVGGPVGAAVGGLVGLGGGILGSIFNRNSMRNKIAQLNLRIQNTNNYNLGLADSSYLLNQYANKYGSSLDDNLFNNGKNANSLVGHGETIVNGNTGDLHEVIGGTRPGIDNVPANINPQDAIAGNKRNPNTGHTFALDMKPLSRMESKLNRNKDRNNDTLANNTEKMVKRYTQPAAQLILNQLRAVLGGNKTNKYANGKDWLSPTVNTLSALAPTIYNFIKGSLSALTVSPEELYATNPYDLQVLTTLANRRYNANPELDSLAQNEMINRYNTRALGNEAGINRAMDVENDIQSQRSAADILSRKQTTDNGYMSDWASMAAQLGLQSAALHSAAMQTAWDANNRNLAARNNYTQAGIEGLSNYMLNAQKEQNENNSNAFLQDLMQKMYNLYYKAQPNGLTKANSLLGLLGSPSVNRLSLIPVSTTYKMPQWYDYMNNPLPMPYANPTKAQTPMINTQPVVPFNSAFNLSYTNPYGKLPYINNL